MQKNVSKSSVRIFLFISFILLSLYYFNKINLANSDIPRHIANGRFLMENKDVLYKNFFSYTEKEHSFINHHWLSGYIFFQIWTFGGFKLLTLLYGFISGISVLAFTWSSTKIVDIKKSLLITFLLIPLFTGRVEVRPEVFSYFFLGVFFLISLKYLKEEISIKKMALILAPITILWINTHIFVVFGIFVIGSLAVHFLINKDFAKFRKLTLLTLLLFLISLINPSFIKGVLEPINIFREYGYRVAENQTIFFMQKFSGGFIYFYTQLVALLGLIGIVNLAKSKSFKKNAFYLINFLVFLILAFLINRMIILFGLVSIICLTAFYKDKIDKYFKSTFLYTSVVLLVLLAVLPSNPFTIFTPSFGTGIISETDDSGDFYLNNNLEGPIFNNYDIGGYLIFKLYPKEKVFVDNRPEAYSVNFFQEVYIPMQENEDVWNKVNEKYKFNVIYFNRRDQTNWGQEFLVKRIEDSNWVPIYVDNYVIIFVKNNEKNKEIIKKYKLPKEMFRISKN